MEKEKPQFEIDYGYKVNYTGFINDDEKLKLYYSASNLFIIPSMQDNLPGTGIESHACGTPVIGFNIGGLPDIVTDKVTGALVNPFDTNSLADKIKWSIEDDERNFILGKNA